MRREKLMQLCKQLTRAGYLAVVSIFLSSGAQAAVVACDTCDIGDNASATGGTCVCTCSYTIVCRDKTKKPCLTPTSLAAIKSQDRCKEQINKSCTPKISTWTSLDTSNPPKYTSCSWNGTPIPAPTTPPSTKAPSSAQPD
jgi:hypothetical protein